MENTRYLRGEKGRLAGSVSLGGKNAPTAAPDGTAAAGLSHGDAEPGVDLAELHARLQALPGPGAPGDPIPVPVTGPHLYDLFPQGTYEASLAAGHIRVQTHPDPDVPYLIHNYTDACTWDNGWNEATLTCRGLITHADTGEVIARPFGKFFNHDQPGAPALGIDDDVVVMDKADGSMGCLYPLPDGTYQVATRGSFASEQAVWASQFYDRTYAGQWEPNPRWTYVYEVIAPFNRVVLSYGDTEDLILLGAVETATGRSVHVHEAARGWPGPTVEVMPHTTLRQALEAPDRENAEGFVVWHPATDSRVKIKQEDYKRLHRWLTSTTSKHVWEVLSSGEDPDVVFAAAPDEFHDWLKGQVGELRGQHTARVSAAKAAFTAVTSSLPSGFGRKEFAMAVAKHPDKSLLFALLDGKSIDETVWRSLKPTGESGTVRRVSVDAD